MDAFNKVVKEVAEPHGASQTAFPFIITHLAIETPGVTITHITLLSKTLLRATVPQHALSDEHRYQ
jgi:hypothetical protein